MISQMRNFLLTVQLMTQVIANNWDSQALSRHALTVRNRGSCSTLLEPIFGKLDSLIENSVSVSSLKSQLKLQILFNALVANLLLLLLAWRCSNCKTYIYIYIYMYICVCVCDRFPSVMIISQEMDVGGALVGDPDWTFLPLKSPIRRYL